MFEHRSEPLLPRPQFYARMARSFAVTLGIVAASLIMGSAGYHFFGGLAWIDALLNAAMILTGMGPVNPMTTAAGKLFATFYALYSGIAFLSMVAVILGPVVHRLLHKFHLDEDAEDDEQGS
jgi:hypothetical protein